MMSFTTKTYEDGVYERLEESILEYMDESMVNKLIPHLRKALLDELEVRRKSVSQLESVVRTLFPMTNCETFN